MVACQKKRGVGANGVRAGTGGLRRTRGAGRDDRSRLTLRKDADVETSSRGDSSSIEILRDPREGHSNESDIELDPSRAATAQSFLTPSFYLIGRPVAMSMFIGSPRENLAMLSPHMLTTR